MIGLLIRRESCTSSIAPYVEVHPPPGHEQRGEIAVEEAWMGIYFQDNKIGWLHHTGEPSDDGYVLREESLTRLKMMDTPQTIWAGTTCRTDPNFVLTSFVFQLKSNVASLKVSGKVDVKTVHLTIESAGKTQKKAIRLHRPPYLFTTLKPYLTMADLEKGKSFRLPVVLPSTLSQADTVLTVEGREEIEIHGETWEAFRIQVSYAGMEATTWCDPEGRILKEVTPMGLILVREDARKAREGLKLGKDAVDITTSTMVPVDEPLKDPTELRYLRVRLTGIDPTRFEMQGGRQRLEQGILEVRKEEFSALPQTGIPVPNAVLQDFVGPTPSLQSDNEKIRQLARKIIGHEEDGVEVARLLMDWTYKNLEKRPTVSLPNALEVLEQRAGDCNEHAALMAALARSVGLPARVAVGVVYTGTGFFYHAWNEVWVGSWVTLDPVMAQFPADVTHVKFIDGGLEEQIRMAQVIGRLSMEILECR
jgi:hypothetical protein